MAKNRLTSIEKRRRLEALFERGGYVRFRSGPDGGVIVKDDDDEHDDDMKIWIGPPNPFQREMAIREAQAGRARAMLDVKESPDSTNGLTARAFIQAMPLNDLADYIMDLNESDRLQAARRDVLSHKEWADFNALRDAMRQFDEAGSPTEDPEWRTLLDRDVQFGNEVETRAQEIRDGDREGYLLQPRTELEKKALDKRIDQMGSMRFMLIYEEWMLFYSCRDDEDHSVLYFESVADLKSMPEEISTALAEKLSQYIGDAADAKNSPGADSGSDLLEPPASPEISELSIPEESIA
jgi:hypothetical protein